MWLSLFSPCLGRHGGLGAAVRHQLPRTTRTRRTTGSPAPTPSLPSIPGSPGHSLPSGPLPSSHAHGPLLAALQGVPGLPGVKVRSPSNAFLALCRSQLQEPGSILAGCPWGCSCSDTSFLAGGGRQPWAAWLARTKGRSTGILGRAVCKHLGFAGPLCSPARGCQEDAPFCISPFPTPRCREMLACPAWMAALAWRASPGHR